MAPKIAVLGAGYGGAAAIRSLQSEVDDADLVWIADEPYHLVLHEVHRCIRDPSIREEITIPVGEIAADDTQFVQDTVTDVDVDDRRIELESQGSIDYDYVVVALGSQTAFFGIDGMDEHALTLKTLGDALSIHEQLEDAARDATRAEPAQVVVGGAGLTGIQIAGEIAAWRDETDAQVDVHLVEREPHVFPGHHPEFQGALRKKLQDADVELHMGAACSSVDADTLHFDQHDDMPYDVLVWAGGVTGRDALEETDVEKDRDRAYTDATLETSDDRVFALGDSALVDQDTEDEPVDEMGIWQQITDPDTDSVPPPTAEAAMEEGEHLGENVAQRLRGEDPTDWAYVDKGTLVSIGDDAVAHDVLGVPLNTFSGPAARTLKRAISARWLAKVASPQHAVSAWSDM